MLYFICGHRGCGKNYLAEKIASKKDIKIIDTGKTIREIYGRNNNGKSFKDWMIDGEKKFGNDFSNKVICENVNIESKKNYIVVGFRSLEGIKFFNEYFSNSSFNIIYIDGNYELFKDNFNYREGTNISLEEYLSTAKIEDDMGIKSIQEYAQNRERYSKYYFKTENNEDIFNDLLKNMEKNEIEMER